MAFEDIKGVSYDKLIEHTQKVKPYKGSDNAYNLGYRKYSDRHFRVNKNGVIEVFFTYMGNVKHRIQNGEDEYSSGRHLASIHPDNSIEIVNYNGQGDIQFLSAIIPYVTHSKAHHGLLVRTFNNSNKGDQTHPVFRGGRFHLESHETMTPYILQPRAVNRKLRKEVIARFDTFKKVGLTMFSALSSHGIYELYAELWNEYGEETMYSITPDLIVNLANEGKALDAVLLSTLSKGDFGWYSLWKVRQVLLDRSNGVDSDSRINNYFGDDFKRSMTEVYSDGAEGEDKLNDLLIKGSPDAFHYKDPIPNGQAIPSSKWGYKLTDMSGKNLIRID
jgi:hypothetical protein